MAEKKITIREIAKEANVSTGTVSRYLNGAANLRKDASERIEQAIDKYHYTPDRSARALKSGKRNLICLAYPESDNPFFFNIVSAIEESVRRSGYSLMINHTHGDPAEELKVLALTKEGIMDGLILVNFNYTPEHFDAFKRVGCPLVISSLCISPYGGGTDDSFDYIGIDVFSALHMTTKHLIDRGHRKIAYIGGPQEMCVFRERYEGYSSALVQAGIEVDRKYCFLGEYDEQAGYDAGKAIASMADRPTAICTASDVIAIGAMIALREHGVSIPGDIAVIGLDNISFDRALTPQLSSVCMRQEDVGRCAVEMLFSRIQGNDEAPRKVIFQPELILRESSDTCCDTHQDDGRK